MIVTLLILSFTSVTALVALLAFWKMETTLSRHGIHVRAFKYPKDVAEVFDKYGVLARECSYNQWPRAVFVISFVGMVVSFFLMCIYVLPKLGK